jgi:hypothetical protein
MSDKRTYIMSRTFLCDTQGDSNVCHDDSELTRSRETWGRPMLGLILLSMGQRINTEIPFMSINMR